MSKTQLRRKIRRLERVLESRDAIISMLLESNSIFYSESVLDAHDIQELRDALQFALDTIDRLRE